MSTHDASSQTAKALGKRPALLLAEFPTASAVVHAAEKVRDAGYTQWDAHTPFPIHGMDKAMGLSDSKLGWIVIVMAVTGLSTGLSLYTFMNWVDYPLIIGGKPPSAWPASIPVFFELTILFSAFGAVFGMFHLNKIPRHHHPIFESDRFRAATDDKFFISVEAGDPKFDVNRTRALLESAHAAAVEVVLEEA
jgi:hypothetical protein